jgi:hypothetical protein
VGDQGVEGIDPLSRLSLGSIIVKWIKLGLDTWK